MTTSHSLQAQDVTLHYGDRVIAQDLSLSIAPGKITSIIGPNGCGKSTLLKSLARLLHPSTGRVELDGKKLQEWGSKELARTLGLLPQTPLAPEGITVVDLVGRGRTPYQGMLGQWSSDDYDAVAQAMTMTGVAELAERSIEELSGGQRQRVWIAMALAQRTDVLLLDEPTTYLDVAHQLDVLDLLKELNLTHQTTIVMVLHDLNLAARYSDELVAMRDGAIVTSGTPEHVVTQDNVQRIFNVKSQVITDPVFGSPLVTPIGRY
ncbi:ABC transporter ATP-binding protein [Corynebacterium sp. 320]|uniref:ABC transporter ATP-binding protein n=1 Tax=Corynebacterium TaxID=1716 RepID=UPI00125CCF35|nr:MULTISPECIES: ABC transporter ATP-binding protein [Corynebacterium]KAB1503923.1 ABC transporter ATP-binding protein [Corynebacterium sp. 320]KAB1552978.1 ABC transporter ATP-binding protein [Corynebacterium sp. 321]KAB1553802.1 ABC transporter ATP-binding protein [Corynebacterium sp. 319]KAB3528059.1 ABC transporter ATP-binding protein [Corynebacterium sp. 250]KAB3540453.1 ABC transporter ATP-binding protein [Corynebacterium sp. 366]